MNPSNLLLVFLLVSATTTLIVSLDNSEYVLKSHNILSKSEIIDLKGAIGPESVAFDPNGEGPYVGVADGRILKWKGSSNWVDFAVTSSHRKNCTLPFAPEMEHVCGRPLGLRFSNKTGELYIADAYLGLQVVGSKGGLATPLVQKIYGKPLVFTNDIDIDDHDDVIYFTDTSTKYQRRQFIESLSSGDSTGRLMKFVKSTNKVTVLLGNISFANGVALSKNRTFVLVAETSNFRILRYWLKGPLAGTHDIFSELPGFPDNIRMNSRGEFWVALQTVSSQLHATAIRLSEEGQVLEVLEDIEGKTLKSISQVEEKHDQLWFGSVVMPFLGVYEFNFN